MSKYATNQMFGGQRASVGRTVLVCQPRHDDKPGTCLRAGMIVAVSATDDAPWIVDIKHPDQLSKDRPFFEAPTPEVLEEMPAGSWTWPPRI